ncbi:MAG: PhoH family protein [Candidatus Marinimicrobia bacterium]|nr:PhoH family protein [Candidatus Neomarinimicrobiota bacterium]
MKAKRKKTFVLDTNVILHDSSCIYQFNEHDIIIPIGVLEELDKFKSGNETINFHAREFVRTLDSIFDNKIFKTGIQIREGLGKITIKLEREFHPDIKQNFAESKVDHHILNTAYCMAQENPKGELVLITKDVNLRMKAKALGLKAEDYTSDHVTDISELYKGHRVVEDINTELIDQMYSPPYYFEKSRLEIEHKILPNEALIMKNQRKSALAIYDAEMMRINHVEKLMAYGITPRNAEQTFALNILLNSNIKLITLTGKAGTGKTLLALAAAIECRRNFRQIFMARPIVPLSNKDIGYLPGDVDSKLTPYMQPLFDNLGVIKNQFPENDKRANLIDELLEKEKLKISPLSYIRGRSLVKIFFIVDEAQNLTPLEIKTIITRAGENTKLVFTGDIFQIDHPYLDTHSNGLVYLIDKMKGQKLYAHINLEKGERSELAELASDLL